jgi:hypothetical protein
MNELLSLIELDGREVIVRLCEPYQLVRNDILSYNIASVNSEYEVNSHEIDPDKDAINKSISKVSKWLMDLETDVLDNTEIEINKMINEEESIVNEAVN